jgi:hypothetical protein
MPAGDGAIFLKFSLQMGATLTTILPPTRVCTVRFKNEQEIFLDRYKGLNKLNPMAVRPVFYGDLAQYSVYYQILGGDEELLSDAFNETIEMDGNGCIAYYCAQSNGEFIREEPGKSGDFVRVLKGNGEETFVHYSQIFQPNMDGKSRMDITMVVLGISYQCAAYQTSLLNNLLDNVEDLNRQMNKLTELYSKYASMQNNIPGQGGAVELTYEHLQTLIDLGINPPQSEMMVAVKKQVYMTAYTTDYFGEGYVVRVYIGYADNYKYASADFNNYSDPDPPPGGASLMNDTYNHLMTGGGYPGDHFSVPRYSSEFWGYGAGETSGKKYTAIHGVAARLANLEYGTIEEINNYLNASDRTVKILSGDIAGDGSGTADGGILSLNSNGSWSVIAEAADSSNNMEATLTPNYYPVTISKEEVISEKRNFFLVKQDLQSFCDTIRIAMDNFSSKISSWMSMVSYANNELNQAYSIGSNLISKLENTEKATARNVR